MSEVVKSSSTTVSTEGAPIEVLSQKPKATAFQTMQGSIYFVFGILETLLALRFFLKLTGASHSSSFVNFIDTVTGIFIRPFEGIFSRSTASGSSSGVMFEPATFIALLLYPLLAWGIGTLISVASRQSQE